MLSPRQTLLNAAEKLETLVHASTDGPWDFDAYVVNDMSGQDEFYLVLSRDDVVAEPENDADAEFIATMDPRVAEDLAELFRYGAAIWAGDGEPAPDMLSGKFLQLARSVLDHSL